MAAFASSKRFHRSQTRASKYAIYSAWAVIIVVLLYFIRASILNEDLSDDASLDSGVADVARFDHEELDALRFANHSATPHKRIFDFVPPTAIAIVSEYAKGGIPQPRTFNNVILCTSQPSEGGPFERHSIAAIVMTQEGKIIDTSSKYLSWFINGELDYFPVPIGAHFQSCYEKSLAVLDKSGMNELPTIEEPVFLGFDSFPCMPSHNIEDKLNLFTSFYKHGLKMPWLVPTMDDFYYQRFDKFLHDISGIDYRHFDVNRLYRVQNLTMVHNFNHATPEAKALFQDHFVPKILQKYEGSPYYDRIALLKLASTSSTSHSPGRSHLCTEKFFNKLKKMNITLLEASKYDQEHIVYLINKAKYILVSWGASFFANYVMFRAHKDMLDTVVLGHSGYAPEWSFLGPDRTQYAQHPSLADVNSKNEKYLLNVDDLDLLNEADLSYNKAFSRVKYTCDSC